MNPVRDMGWRNRMWVMRNLHHHCLRWLVDGGVPIAVISRIVGHKNMYVTLSLYVGPNNVVK